MKFIADLHIHSKYSRATSKNLDLENIYIAAQLKGITVVGTGDATHPGWFAELSEKLVPAEQGLYELRKDIAEVCDRQVPKICRAPVRYVLQAEISNIYKKNGRTRKNHNLIFMPDLRTANAFKNRLDGIGNVRSDGRPILGLDAKHLLEIALEISHESFLIPAHIWTPWFSILGSKSGFDSIEECFEDLSPHIFAVETGLSSDPVMNRLVSSLDRLTLISNSDAHSPPNLGREVNMFDTILSYDAIRKALEKKGNNGFLGTIEFYPEEGKYHLDGHRKCRIRFSPEETRKQENICPVCGKPLTLGVLNRVMALADRKSHKDAPTEEVFYHRVPLVGVLSEILKTGPRSKKVQRAYYTLISTFGNELGILNDIDTKDMERSGGFLLSEAIDRMRSGKMKVSPGYDGEFGKIGIFSDMERNELLGQQPMFDRSRDELGITKRMISEKQNTQLIKSFNKDHEKPVVNDNPSESQQKSVDSTDILRSLNEAQKEAVTAPSGPILIVAGPGTGKTLTLTHRIVYLIKKRNVSPENMLAVTFTNKAAQEMRLRLGRQLDSDINPPLVTTFHSLCFQLIRENESFKTVTVISEKDRRHLIGFAMKQVMGKNEIKIGDIESAQTAIVDAKQRIIGPDEFFSEDGSKNKTVSNIYRVYNESLQTQNLLDYEDLIYHTVVRLEMDDVYRRACKKRFKYIFVDEYQDLNQAQYRLIRALSEPGKDIFVIGDPEQSIYAFRGSDHRYFLKFTADFPSAKTFCLNRNYRSAQTVLDAAFQMMDGHRVMLPMIKNQGRKIYSNIRGPKKINILEASSDREEADVVARTIEKLVGGTGYHAVDSGRIQQTDLVDPIGFSDMVVLYRTASQHRSIADSLDQYGIPYQVAGGSGSADTPGIKQLLSLFKVIGEFGHYGDFSNIVHAWKPGISNETVYGFSRWGLGSRYDLSTAMHQATRFPIPDLTRKRQEKLVDFIKILTGFANRTNGMSFEKKLRYLLTHTRLEQLRKKDTAFSSACDRILKVAETSTVMPEAYFSHKAMETDIDTVSFEVQKVFLMTIHAAKGLEFPVVFIVGCEDDLIPFRRSEQDQANEMEERRLFFVAMTRAKQQLFLTWARKRHRFGKEFSRRLSPFVSGIATELIRSQVPVYGKKRRTMQTQMKLF